MARSKIRARNPAFPSRRSQSLFQSASSTEIDDTSNLLKRARPSPTDGVDASASVLGSSSEAGRMNDSQHGPVSSLEEGLIPKTGSLVMARSKIRARNPAFPSRQSQRLFQSASSTETDDTSNPSKRARPSPTDGVDASASVPESSSEAARMNDSQRGPVSSLEEGPIPKTGSKRGGDVCQPIEEGDEDKEDNEDHREEGEDHFDDAKGQVVGDRVVFRKMNKVTEKQLSFFSYVNLHLKSGNVPKNQVHDFKLSLSQKWKELSPEEKANYVHPDKEGYSSASYSEGSMPGVYKVDTRTSPHRFKSLIGEFNEEKLAACRELGFGPLLKLAITKVHLSILRLIVDATSTSDKSITMHGTKLPLSANDVENVMGLKNGGSPVVFEGHVKDYTELEATANEMAGPNHKIQLAKVEAYLKETQLMDDKFK
ncbi:hypothetical protein ACLB2K_029896 [Fragaria x ananassa]